MVPIRAHLKGTSFCAGQHILPKFRHAKTLPIIRVRRDPCDEFPHRLAVDAYWSHGWIRIGYIEDIIAQQIYRTVQNGEFIQAKAYCLEGRRTAEGLKVGLWMDLEVA